MKFSVAGIAVLAAVGSIVFGVLNNFKAKASLKWPSVEGKIVVSEVISNPITAIVDDAGLDFEYEYEVDGQVYTADRIDFGEPFSMSSALSYSLARSR